MLKKIMPAVMAMFLCAAVSHAEESITIQILHKSFPNVKAEKAGKTVAELTARLAKIESSKPAGVGAGGVGGCVDTGHGRLHASGTAGAEIGMRTSALARSAGSNGSG